MKILFCDNSLRELVNFRGDVIDFYAQNGNQVVLVAPKNYDFSELGGNVKYVPVQLSRSGMNPFSDAKYFFSLLRIYRKEKPDYIFHYTIKPNIYGSFAAWLCHMPSTAMIAGLGYVFSAKGLKSIMGRNLYRLAMRFPQHVLVLNEYNRQQVIAKGICKSEKVILLKGGEGINLEKFKV
jgi:hypothetical protein